MKLYVANLDANIVMFVLWKVSNGSQWIINCYTKNALYSYRGQYINLSERRKYLNFKFK